MVAGLLVAGCAQNPIYTRAHDRLGGPWKKIQVYGPDRSSDGHDDVWVFCRSEHRTAIGAARSFDGACVIYVCAAGSSSCTES